MWPSLVTEMIERFGFYEGNGTYCRVDPALLEKSWISSSRARSDPGSGGSFFGL